MSTIQLAGPEHETIILGGRALTLLDKLEGHYKHPTADFDLEEIIAEFPHVSFIELFGVFLNLLKEFDVSKLDEFHWLLDNDGIFPSRLKNLPLSEQVALIDTALGAWPNNHQAIIHLFEHLNLPNNSDCRYVVRLFTECALVSEIERGMSHRTSEMSSCVNGLWKVIKSSMHAENLLSN